jgi:hypothetical protein
MGKRAWRTKKGARLGHLWGFFWVNVRERVCVCVLCVCVSHLGISGPGRREPEFDRPRWSPDANLPSQPCMFYPALSHNWLPPASTPSWKEAHPLMGALYTHSPNSKSMIQLFCKTSACVHHTPVGHAPSSHSCPVLWNLLYPELLLLSGLPPTFILCSAGL